MEQRFVHSGNDPFSICSMDCESKIISIHKKLLNHIADLERVLKNDGHEYNV